MFKGTLRWFYTLAYVTTLSALALVIDDWRRGHYYEALVQSRKTLSITQAPAECRNGWEFFRALANQSIARVRIISNIELYEADWSMGASPVVLERNVSVEGTNKEREHWFIININFVKSKVQLGSGAWLSFSNLVLVNGAAGPVFQVPGLVMVASSNATGSKQGPTVPGVLLQNVALIQRTCLPASESYKLLAKVLRPYMIRGNQSYHLNLPQEGCEDSCTVHPVRRCWPQIGRYDDLGSQAYYLDISSGIAREAGYNIHILEADVLCTTVMDEQCIKSANSYIGCFYVMFPRNSTAELLGPQLPVPCLAAASTSQASSHINKALLGAVLGGVLGGIACLATASGIAVLAYRCRRPTYGRSEQQPHATPAGSSLEGGQAHRESVDGDQGNNTGDNGANAGDP